MSSCNALLASRMSSGNGKHKRWLCRKEEFSIKMIASDDDKTIDVVVQGDEEEITRMTNALELKEKGMVYVPGVLEKQA